MGFIKLCRIYLKNVCIWFLSNLLIIIGVIISPIVGLIILYRLVLSLSVKYFRSDLIKILSPASQILAVDNYDTQPACTLLGCFHVEGQIESIEVERDYLLKNFLLKRNEVGELQRPELQQYLCKWLGYYFWKWETNFEIQNHVFEYNGIHVNNEYDSRLVNRIRSELIKKPFKLNQSPWEVTYLSNCRLLDDGNDKTLSTVVFIRFHHYLADGISALNIINDITFTTENQQQQPYFYQQQQWSLSQQFLIHIKTLLLGPYEFTKFIIGGLDVNSSLLTIPPSPSLPTSHSRNNIHFMTNDAIMDVKDVKRIKVKYGTSFSSVLFACIAGGLRKFLLESQLVLPKIIHYLIALPMPNHPKTKLCNHYTLVFAKLPLGINNPQDRLKEIEKNIIKLKTSTCPLFMFYFLRVAGCVFPWMTKWLVNQNRVSGIISSVPGPTNIIIYNNNPKHKIMDYNFTSGLLEGRAGVVFYISSYNGKVSIGAGIHEGLIPNQNVFSQLRNYILNEFELLSSSSSSSII